MADFNGIGSSVDQQPFPPFVQQLVEPHLPDCPDKLSLLDQCPHCYAYAASYDLPRQPLQQPQQSQPVLNHSQEQYYTPRTPPTSQPAWPDGVADAMADAMSDPVSPTSSTPTVCVTSFAESTRMIQAELAVAEAQFPALASDSFPAPASPHQTYAQVPQRPASLFSWSPSSFYLQTDRSASQPDDFTQGVGSPDTLSPYTEPRLHPHPHEQGQGRDTQFVPHESAVRPSAYSSPSQHEQHPHDFLQPSLAFFSRDIEQFLSQVRRSGHRRPRLNIGGDSFGDSPVSPGASSVASSQWSRPSSRRKGPALRDPSLPFRCSECPNTFAKHDDRRRHVDRCHGNKADRRHRCDEPGCSRAFVHPKDLRRHYQTHRVHPIRIACPFSPCQKTYTRYDNLQRHISKCHVGDSTYASGPVSLSPTTSSQTHPSQPLLD